MKKKDNIITKKPKTKMLYSYKYNPAVLDIYNINKTKFNIDLNKKYDIIIKKSIKSYSCEKNKMIIEKLIAEKSNNEFYTDIIKNIFNSYEIVRRYERFNHIFINSIFQSEYIIYNSALSLYYKIIYEYIEKTYNLIINKNLPKEKISNDFIRMEELVQTWNIKKEQIKEKEYIKSYYDKRKKSRLEGYNISEINVKESYIFPRFYQTYQYFCIENNASDVHKANEQKLSKCIQFDEYIKSYIKLVDIINKNRDICNLDITYYLFEKDYGFLFILTCCEAIVKNVMDYNLEKYIKDASFVKMLKLIYSIPDIFIRAKTIQMYMKLIKDVMLTVEEFFDSKKIDDITNAIFYFKESFEKKFKHTIKKNESELFTESFLKSYEEACIKHIYDKFKKNPDFHVNNNFEDILNIEFEKDFKQEFKEKFKELYKTTCEKNVFEKAFKKAFLNLHTSTFERDFKEKLENNFDILSERNYNCITELRIDEEFLIKILAVSNKPKNEKTQKLFEIITEYLYINIKEKIYDLINFLEIIEGLAYYSLEDTYKLKTEMHEKIKGYYSNNNFWKQLPKIKEKNKTDIPNDNYRDITEYDQYIKAELKKLNLLNINCSEIENINVKDSSVYETFNNISKIINISDVDYKDEYKKLLTNIQLMTSTNNLINDTAQKIINIKYYGEVYEKEFDFIKSENDEILGIMGKEND